VPAHLGLPGFSRTEREVIAEVRAICLGTLREAFEAGGAQLELAGRTIIVEPAMPASGMTLFGENGFVLGREAFASTEELTKTLLHELYRLGVSQSSGGLGQQLASLETQATFCFAERAWERCFR
jgi:hypothetical protein